MPKGAIIRLLEAIEFHFTRPLLTKPFAPYPMLESEIEGFDEIMADYKARLAEKRAAFAAKKGSNLGEAFF